MVGPRWLVVFLLLVTSLVADGCSCQSTLKNSGPDGAADTCDPDCTGDTVCRYDVCVPTPTSCTTNGDCKGDFYCDTTAGECLPWGVGPGGANDMACKRDPVPGVFFPGAQCEWL